MRSVAAHSSPYRLADHVHACHFDGQVVLLDTRRNKYLGVGGAQLAALSRCIAGWPVTSQDQAPPAKHESLDALVKPLLDQQMLTAASTSRQPALVLDEPLESFDSWHPTQDPSNWRDLLSMAYCASLTAVWLKKRCLAEIAISVRRLRLKEPSGQVETNPEHMRAAVASYLRLRPFLFTAHDRCLHDSLTLVRFLATKRLFPRWVIGVRTRPFAAHSWVQSGPIVLNDVYEHARDYTPILVI
ncbi:lasso peptide biosynthesis B2 protein [Roseateles saccharophilus]|uniref:Transglutaminase superfamily protein n=1 Tax=Roseateles saccharophilus TaxID=304 RepID=A0A4R3U801_ROSSA|nr:lasso peptide biosynthesis B2 protein [Roseateles saccharophilus]TCU83061.1 transglutaminase superfamily protein [Roseateles saccharophilus]